MGIARVAPNWLEKIENRIFSKTQIELNERQSHDLLGNRTIPGQGDIENSNSFQIPVQETLAQSIAQGKQKIDIKDLDKIMEEQERRMQAKIEVQMKQQKKEHDEKIKELTEEVKYLKRGQVVV